MRRHGRAAAGIAVALGLLVPAVAQARVEATARIDSDGTANTLTVRNTGDEVLDCMRFTAADGVEVTGADGPGATQTEPPNRFASQGFGLVPGAETTWTFTTSAPYPSGAGGRLDVSATCAPGSDVTVTATGPGSPSPPPPPPEEPPAEEQPEVGATEIVSVLSGIVLLRVRGARRFVRLTGARTIPDGSEIDTRRGTLRLTVADGAGGTQSAEVSEGRAIVDQDKAAQPTTTLRLSEPLACPRRGRATGSAKRRKRRRIFVRTDGGRFRTRGRHAAAVATGTAWRTTDTCSRTIIEVEEGTVLVTKRGGREVGAGPGRRVVGRPSRRRRG